MMYNRIVWLLVLVPTLLFGQWTERQVQAVSSDPFIIDSTETVNIILMFPNPQGGFSGGAYGDSTATRSTYKRSQVFYDPDDFMIYLKIDSLSTSTEYDSLNVWAWFLSHDGYRISDTLYLDFTNRDTVISSTYYSWVPANRGSAVSYLSADLSSVSVPAFGLELQLDQVANDSVGTGNGIRSQVTATIAASY